MRRRKAPATALFALLYLALAVLNTWPMSARLGTHLPHDLGDPVVSTTLLHWNAVTPLFTERWWNGVGFHPMRDTLTFSDPRLGLWALGAPVWWATGSGVAMYNVLFVLSFALSAIAMHALVFSLTRHHGAALVAACAYGFAPFRAAHLAHLELLASYWMPVALLGLHRWLGDRRPRWLALFAAATAAQGLFCAYYLPMFAVLGGLWTAWFTLGRVRVRQIGALLAAALLGVVVLLPIFLHYREAHAALGFSRGIGEIELYSADLDGLWAIPRELRFWPTIETRNAEGYLFPGLTVVLLVAWSVIRGWRDREPGRHWRHTRRLLLGAAVVVAALALAALVYGPIRVGVAGLTLSISGVRKPLSLVIVAFAAHLLLHPRLVASFRARSTLAFYVLATGVMFALALGPSPALWGVRFFYKAPYAWLMSLPGFDESLRAPARFGMLAALTLSVAAGLAWARLARRMAGPRSHWAAAVLAALVVAEGWSGPSSAHAVPERLRWPRPCARLPRLELPMAGIEHDAAAQYRALLDGVRSVNGTTGWIPPHMLVLPLAIDARDPEALSALAEHGPLCVAIDRATTANRALFRFVAAHPRARRVGGSPQGHRFILIRRVHAPADSPGGAVLPVAGAQSSEGRVDLDSLSDGDPVTAWVTGEPQRGGESLTLQLGCTARVEEVVVSLGGHVTSFAREMAIDFSADGTEWQTSWSGPTGGRMVRAALGNPRMSAAAFPVKAADARYVRLRSLAPDPDAVWAVAELDVLGACKDR